MRVLKRKILKAQQRYHLEVQNTGNDLEEILPDELDLLLISQASTASVEDTNSCSSISQKNVKIASPVTKNNYDVKSTKNIVKNYGRAICNFILSPVAIPYIEDFVKRHNFKVCPKAFKVYISERKEVLDCIERLKNMLTISHTDSEEEVEFKLLFKYIGEVFIKYFSVNWIFNGRMTYKQSHLYFRFKMLRRLKNPELFTYLK
jgi:hypothetical protein